VVLDDILGAEWGEAIGINNGGQAVVRLHLGNTSGAFILWQGRLYNLEAPNPLTRAMYPKRILADTSIVSLAILGNGQRICGLRYPNARWISLMEPLDGREFTAVNDELTITGYDLIDGYQRPWVKRMGAPIEYLSYYGHHHNTPTCITNAHEVLASARADYCTHPLAWISGQTRADD
jgi:hypothetical protein